MNHEFGWIDQSWLLAGAPLKAAKKMTHSARSLADFKTSHRVAALAVAFVLAVPVLALMPGAADARAIRSARAYDGTWNVVFLTRAGNCSSTNSAPFTVSGGRLSSAGGGKVTGGISSAGVVSVRISVGRSVASGSGRLVGNYGAGRWSGIITGDRCSGTWQATRS
jgi:hypothetical protein